MALGPVDPPPSQWLRAAELPRALHGAAALAGAWRSLPRARIGGGRPVMLLPGLVNSDRSLSLLRRYLRDLGYDARGWGLGRNLGVRATGIEAERLIARVRAFAQERGAPVSLVGVSLGGIMARIVAHRAPQAVARVITVASPYAGHPRGTNVWRAFEWLTGERVDDVTVQARLAEARRPLSVPATAIWSASDGLVGGRLCHQPGEPGLTVVRVSSGHVGVQWRPEVLRAVAAALARGQSSRSA